MLYYATVKHIRLGIKFAVSVRSSERPQSSYVVELAGTLSGGAVCPGYPWLNQAPVYSL